MTLGLGPPKPPGLVEVNVELRTGMETLGHSTFGLTMDLYGHVLPSGMQAPRRRRTVCSGG
ncbi:MAG: hypothetical protein ACRDYU_10965 [Actinomycetes bacterium]